MQCQSQKMKKSVLGKYALPTTNGIYQPIRLFFLNVYYEKKNVLWWKLWTDPGNCTSQQIQLVYIIYV